MNSIFDLYKGVSQLPDVLMVPFSVFIDTHTILAHVTAEVCLSTTITHINHYALVLPQLPGPFLTPRLTGISGQLNFYSAHVDCIVLSGWVVPCFSISCGTWLNLASISSGFMVELLQKEIITLFTHAQILAYLITHNTTCSAWMQHAEHRFVPSRCKQDETKGLSSFPHPFHPLIQNHSCLLTHGNLLGLVNKLKWQSLMRVETMAEPELRFICLRKAPLLMPKGTTLRLL